MTADRNAKLHHDAHRPDGPEPGEIVPAPAADRLPAVPVDERRAGLSATYVRRSRLLDYLPAIFSADPFAARFLLIFEDILDPIEELVRAQPAYFDPATAPPALLDWLAQWVDLQDGAGWTTAARRNLIGQIVPIYGSRGTLRALALHLQALNGTAPLISENTDGFRLGSEARLGYNTPLGRERPGHLAITIVTTDPAALDDDLIRAAIDAEVPLGTRYTLHVMPLPGKR